MPFKSKKQARYMFAHKKQLAGQGVDVQEWAAATDFKKLPERAKATSRVIRTRTRGKS